MKTLLVPGWMKSVRYYGDFDGLDIWKQNFVLEDQRSAECIVAHSMGAAYALAEGKIGNEKTKYFLINPVIRKLNFFSWMWRWIRFVFRGGVRVDSQMGAANIFSAFRKAFAVSRLDLDRAVDELKENIIIIRGRMDDFFCDSQMAEIARQKGIQVIEADDLGHEWDEKYKDILRKLMK